MSEQAINTTTPRARGRRAAAAEPVQANRTDELIAAIKAHWRVVLLVAVVSMLIAWTVAMFQPRRYRATALIAITPVTAGLPPYEVLRSVEILQHPMVLASVATLASTPPVAQRAQEGLGGRGDAYATSATVLPNTNLIRVEAEGKDAATAAAIANRLATVLGAETRALYRVYGATTVSPAVRPPAADRPRVARAAASGLVFGFLLGPAIAYALARKRVTLPPV